LLFVDAFIGCPFPSCLCLVSLQYPRPFQTPTFSRFGLPVPHPVPQLRRGTSLLPFKMGVVLSWGGPHFFFVARGKCFGFVWVPPEVWVLCFFFLLNCFILFLHFFPYDVTSPSGSPLCVSVPPPAFRVEHDRVRESVGPLLGPAGPPKLELTRRNCRSLPTSHSLLPRALSAIRNNGSQFSFYSMRCPRIEYFRFYSCESSPFLVHHSGFFFSSSIMSFHPSRLVPFPGFFFVEPLSSFFFSFP